jgi:hypothetical protein
MANRWPVVFTCGIDLRDAVLDTHNRAARLPIDIDDCPIPEARAGSEISDGLYNSERDYLEQIRSVQSIPGQGSRLGRRNTRAAHELPGLAGGATAPLVEIDQGRCIFF